MHEYTPFIVRTIKGANFGYFWGALIFERKKYYNTIFHTKFQISNILPLKEGKLKDTAVNFNQDYSFVNLSLDR